MPRDMHTARTDGGKRRWLMRLLRNSGKSRTALHRNMVLTLTRSLHISKRESYRQDRKLSTFVQRKLSRKTENAKINGKKSPTQALELTAGSWPRRYAAKFLAAATQLDRWLGRFAPSQRP